MPKFSDVDGDTGLVKSLHGYSYSKVKMDKLGSTEYTAVTIIVDQTTSVSYFKNSLEEMIKTIVQACKKSPRALNLLIRIIAFNSYTIKEIHGWMLLNEINPDDYMGTINPDGCTNLYDATLNGIDVIHHYLVDLYNSETICNANAIVHVITDGDDNSSSSKPEDIRNTIRKIRQEEVVESIRTILIGVNDTDSHFKNRLETFVKEAEMDEYISMGEVTESKLAKLSQFISQSISSQSSALGTGQPSQPIKDFKF